MKNMSKDVKEEKRASSDEIANNLQAKWCWKSGKPESWLTPPGTVAEYAKATVATRAASKEQESPVLLSHFLLLSRRFSCFLVKISSGQNPSPFLRKLNPLGMEFLTCCNWKKTNLEVNKPS